MKLLYLIFPLIFIFGNDVIAKRLPETIIKIGLIQNSKSFNFSCEGKYYLYEMNTGSNIDIQPMNDYLVRGKGNKISVGRETYSSPVRLVSKDNHNLLRINGRRYHDNILIKCNDSKLTVINELGLEDYICGVLPREINPDWPLEAIKTQAVVSRTYALRNLNRHKSEGFDLCTNVHCQVYGGVESEDERCNRAVKLTRGRVLTHKGELAQALFHACCAGHTEHPNNVWIWNDNTPSYLYGRKCKFCAKSPHYYWKREIKKDTIRHELRKNGYKVGNIKSITMIGKSKSGRTKILKIGHSNGTLKISAAKFRLAISPWLVKSTLLDSIIKKGNCFEFKGRGWGHAVGLCQWGAKGMAEKGYNYKQILKYYYSGTDVETWEE